MICYKIIKTKHKTIFLFHNKKPINLVIYKVRIQNKVNLKNKKDKFFI